MAHGKPGTTLWDFWRPGFGSTSQVSLKAAKDAADYWYRSRMMMGLEPAAIGGGDAKLHRDIRDCIDVLHMVLSDTKLGVESRGGIVGCVNVLTAALREGE
jgi:hypothetical protein